MHGVGGTRLVLPGEGSQRAQGPMEPTARELAIWGTLWGPGRGLGVLWGPRDPGRGTEGEE